MLIQQRPVEGQTQDLALLVCDDRHLLLKWVDCLNMAAYDLLHGF